MRRNCIFSVVMLVMLIAGCQRSEEVTVTPPDPKEPETPADVATTEPPAEEVVVPVEPVSEPEPTTADPPPEETTVTERAVEPPPRPPKMPDIDESEFGPSPETIFASYAFPPTLSDTEWHANAWDVNDCLRCHETGVGKAPRVFHRGMADVLLRAKCRSCHVLIPGQSADEVVIKSDEEQFFDKYAFPPMLPNSRAHVDSWTSDDCMRCHEDGLKGAPVTKHASVHMPRLLLKVKCRTCHVQVRAIESTLAIE